uniref:MSP domain-containing protein n=1 Tax=Parascaris univalens TaxID=6257 RepID=A0A915BNR9_PARUN
NVLTVEPRSAQFDATGGTSTHRLQNSRFARLAFKIKSTDIEHYRFRPVYGFIEPQSITSFTIKRLSGEAADSKIIIQFAEVAFDCVDPKAPFMADAEQGEIVITISAV